MDRGAGRLEWQRVTESQTQLTTAQHQTKSMKYQLLGRKLFCSHILLKLFKEKCILKLRLFMSMLRVLSNSVF